MIDRQRASERAGDGRTADQPDGPAGHDDVIGGLLECLEGEVHGSDGEEGEGVDGDHDEHEHGVDGDLDPVGHQLQVQEVRRLVLHAVLRGEVHRVD